MITITHRSHRRGRVSFSSFPPPPRSSPTGLQPSSTLSSAPPQPSSLASVSLPAHHPRTRSRGRRSEARALALVIWETEARGKSLVGGCGAMLFCLRTRSCSEFLHNHPIHSFVLDRMVVA